VSAVWAAIVTGIGLLFAIGGVACGVIGFARTIHDYDTEPVWIWGGRQVQNARRALGRPQPREHVKTGAGVATGTGSAFNVTAQADHPADTPLDVLVGILTRRVDAAVAQATIDRDRTEQATAGLMADLDAHAQRLDSADLELEKLAKSTVVSSARLQLWGLILVGAGTGMMAIPTIAAAFG
jgi:hypothetical protein